MKSVLDITVSCFRSYPCPDNPKPVNLLTWLRSDKYAGQVAHIRTLADKAGRDKLKAALPCITPSGTFSHRSEKSLLQHSGLICLDIDYKENRHIGNFDTLKTCLSHLENVAYCGLSVSGQGYFVLIPIADPARHKNHFYALQQDFSSLGIELDAACKDVSRLRGYSYDPEGYFNHIAKPYYKTSPLLPGSNPLTPEGGTMPGTMAEPVLSRTLLRGAEGLVSQILAQGVDITAGYRAWFEIGCSLANEYGEAGRDHFHSVSRFHAGYDPTATDKQFTACLKNRYSYTIATFYKYCKDYGMLLTEPDVPASLSAFTLPTTPLQRLTQQYPFIKDLMEKLDLEVIEH
jgi:hypothetical protein